MKNNILAVRGKNLSHRQYRLEDEKNRFSQALPFQDQSVVLENTQGQTVGRLKHKN